MTVKVSIVRELDKKVISTTYENVMKFEEISPFELENTGYEVEDITERYYRITHAVYGGVETATYSGKCKFEITV